MAPGNGPNVAPARKIFLFVKHLLGMRNAHKILVRKSGQRLLGTRDDTATQYYKARRARVH
jgi:hypothetical protein